MHISDLSSCQNVPLPRTIPSKEIAPKQIKPGATEESSSLTSFLGCLPILRRLESYAVLLAVCTEQGAGEANKARERRAQ